jgi:hypothetical protein
MIGSDYLTDVAAPEVEKARRWTRPGMADFCDPSLGRQCGDCVHWIKALKARRYGHCGEYRRLMGGKLGPRLENTQLACGKFRHSAGT